MAAPGTFVSNFSNGQLFVMDKDNDMILTLTLDQGDFSVSGLSDRLREVAAYETRGALRGVALTTRSYPTLSFTSLISEWSDASAGTVLDMITGAGEYAARVSTLGANHPVILLNVKLRVVDYNGSNNDLEFHDVGLTFDFGEGDPNSLSLSGTVYGEVSGDLSIDG